MKNLLITNQKVIRDTRASVLLEDKIQNDLDGCLNLTGIEVLSDFTHTPHNPKEESLFVGLQNYISWIIKYFENVLSNNTLAETKKKSPYDFYISCTIDSENHKAKVHFYLDGDIFGLVVGSGYSNLQMLIKASFPIFSKLALDVEFKVFSIGGEPNIY